MPASLEIIRIGDKVVDSIAHSSVPMPQPSRPDQDSRLMAAAQALEAGFLSEMLKAVNLNTQPGAFGGGQGEEQFQSFLRDAQAKHMVEAGGIGLAQSLFEAMKADLND